MTDQPEIMALSAFFTWLVGHGARALALRAGWSRTQRAWIARGAPLVGAGLAYGFGTLLGGGTWRDAVSGDVGGAIAVWWRQAQPREEERQVPTGRVE